MKMLHMVAFLLLVGGGLNWGLVGLFDFNLVTMLLGSMPVLEKLVYILVGVSAVYIAVGTTVVRTLESWANNLKPSGSTNLFIQPGYKFKIIDGLITNFHVPQSSLLMLVSALTGREKLLKIYKKAIENNFRFFSFGDGMLIT
jgi:uncharacterized membrane protein YuzA (DUF378 family)